jgi:hypothetical protein
MQEHASSKKLEEFTRWFLRFNGYFSIENFIVHAADDPMRISGGVVAPHTETDTLAIRMPYSKEITGRLKIANYTPLVEGSDGRMDVIIAESKSGGENRPNKVWREKEQRAVEYITRFVGLCETEEEIGKVSCGLLSKYFYENERARYRYIIFSEEPNAHYRDKGIGYMTYEDLVRFLVSVRGECWVTANIGVASVHDQWNPLIKEVFEIANDQSRPIDERRKEALRKILED